MTRIGVKRIHESPADDDGHRVLVDRIWPRGISKERAALHAWMPEVAPSHELRRWFGHDPDRWDEFRVRYAEELQANPAVDDLMRLASEPEPLTLLYSARDTERNQAVALAAYLDQTAS